MLSDESCLKLNLLLSRLEASPEYVTMCLRHNADDGLAVEAKRDLLDSLPTQEHVRPRTIQSYLELK